MALCKEIGTDSGKTLTTSTTGSMALDFCADN